MDKMLPSGGAKDDQILLHQMDLLQPILNRMRPKKRWFPVFVDDMPLTEFLLTMSCNLDSKGMQELEDIDTAVIIEYFKACDKITEFKTQMAELEVNA
jgi:hypothetical protein